MYHQIVKDYVQTTFKSADVHLNGNRPWDIQVVNDDFFHRLLWNGSLGFGEAYMDGWIESSQLDESIHRIMCSTLSKKYNPLWVIVRGTLNSLASNQQTKHRALEVGKRHYDLSNHLFKCMLDKRMTYSCGYWKDAKNLDEAQEAKLELICQKIRLKPGMRVLDIGCGWGSFSKYAAEKYGAHVVGITISQEQLKLAKHICKGLPVELRFQDYRDVDEPFDRIVSVGQMEHVGHKNHRIYMETAHKVLKEDGIFLLHTIGNNETVYCSDPWITKYIFPNGMVPSSSQLTKASEGLFIMEDWHNFGADYDKTLMAWFRNFDRHWHELKNQYTEVFYRMWKYYLLTCAGAFRARQLQLWQIVYTKKGILGGYTSVR